jgi:hypothetical protein
MSALSTPSTCNLKQNKDKRKSVKPKKKEERKSSSCPKPNKGKTQGNLIQGKTSAPQDRGKRLNAPMQRAC